MISTIISIIIGLLILSVIIIAHELGHFITAKISKVRVEEFGLGFPPRLISFKKGETRYSLNAIPFGGFNKLAGEEDPSLPGSLAGKSIGTRLWVISAGSLANLFLPIFLFSIAFMVPHDFVSGQVLIEEVVPDSPAAQSGIEAGDVFVSINGQLLHNSAELNRQIYLNLGKEVAILVKHPDSTTEEVRLIPRWKTVSVGIKYTTSDYTITREHYPFWLAIPMGARECIETLILYKNGIIGMIIGAFPAQVAGPVGIAQITGEVAKAGLNPLLELSGFISIALGITNLFPLPALDGGRIVFVLLEAIRRGKRVSPKIEALVHFIGFVLLMAVLLVITYQDIVRIISGESLIP